MFVLLIALASCAPRDNPYDPLSPYRFSQITGSVTNLRGNEPVAGAVVMLDSSELEITSEDGTFRFYTREGIHHLTVMGDGILEKDTVLEVAKHDEVQLTMPVDRLPVITNTAVNSDHIASTMYGEQYFLKLSCSVSDPDGEYEIDSVVAVIESQRYMMEQVGMDSFAVAIPESALPLHDIYEIMGSPIAIEARDIHGGRAVESPLYLARVISSIPQGIEPIGGHFTSATPTLVWHSMDTGFDLTYQIEVYTAPIGQPPSLILREEGIRDTVYTVPNPLPTGYYYWLVYCVDNFGNRSRSVEYLFIVQGER